MPRVENLYNYISKTIIGRLATPVDELRALYNAILDAGPGDHVEIGCLWGGTAIVAAIIKEQFNLPGHVYTIDPMAGGWWDTQDPAVKLQPTPGRVLDNFVRFNVAHRISVIRCKSHPWPLPSDIHPVSIFIDGDHEYRGVKVDAQMVKKLGAKIIAFHDYDSIHTGVKQALDEEFPCPEWLENGTVRTLKVYRHV